MFHTLAVIAAVWAGIAVLAALFVGRFIRVGSRPVPRHRSAPVVEVKIKEMLK